MKTFFIKIIKNNQGVSLLELLVAVSIFTVVILSSTQIFKMVIEGQRNAIASQNIQESLRYALEAISKEIRNAEKSDHDCETIFTPAATATYKVYNTKDSDAILYFKNQNGFCVAYYLENDNGVSRLKIYRDGEVAFVTPREIEVNNLKFLVNDDEINAFHSQQPKVSITMDIEAIGKAIHTQPIRIQTTISSRYYE